MKFIKIFLGIFIILGLLLVLVENTETVTINLLFYSFENTKVAVLILISSGIGILVGYGLIVTSLISSKSEIRSLKHKAQSISNELNDLRNADIDSDIYDAQIEE